MPNVLALDTATKACSIALSDGKAVYGRHEILPRAHDLYILDMLSEILGDSSLSECVDVIACGIGPGSFTGLRVAISVAQGLAWSQSLPVHAFCSLTAQVYSAHSENLIREDDCVVSTIDAQIDQVYCRWGHWKNGCFESSGLPFISPPEQLQNPLGARRVVVLGSGLRYDCRLRAFAKTDWKHPEITPNASVMARRLASANIRLDPQKPEALQPQYVQTEIGWKKISEQA